MDAGTAEVILRTHDPARLEEMRGAVLSLVAQTHRPLRAIIVTQRFGPAALAALEDMLAPYRALDPGVALDVVPYDGPGPADARAALINHGIAAARGRWLSLLDYDDTLYPHACATMVAELRASGRALGFGGIAIKSVAADPALPLGIAFARTGRAPGAGALDAFRANFCPVHSMMLDRTRIAPELLRVDEGLRIFEDYEWQLRLIARHPASYAALGRIIGEYRYKTDGSNTVLLKGEQYSPKWAFWMRQECEIEARRRRIEVSPEVLEAIGIARPPAGLTIRALLDAVDAGLLTPRPATVLLPRITSCASEDLML